MSSKLVWPVAGVTALGVGALIAGGLPGSLGLPLPPVALVALVVVLASLPILLTRWRTTLGILIVWLVVEDLVRKLSGNDLRVYFVKDVIYLVLLLGLAMTPRVLEAWRLATGNARLPLYALVIWAVVLSVPTGLEDWRVPLVGLRLDFMYAPLVLAGFLVARDGDRLGMWLAGIAVVGGAAGLIGLIQAVVGPSFLAPQVPTPELENLVLYRGSDGSVFRPTGTFVDPGRFASMVLVAFAVAVGTYLVSRGSRRWLSLGSAMAAGGAVWVSGGRTGVLIAAGLILLASAAPAYAERRPAIGRGLIVAATGVATLVIVGVAYPDLFTSRLAWYRDTLDPRSPSNEWSFRWEAAVGNTTRGVAGGGLIGLGTGSQSLGRQYLTGQTEEPSSPASDVEVEGGYAAVAVEWGLIGLVIWMVWSVAWFTRLWRAVQRSRDGPFAAAGLVVLGWVFFFLFVGFVGAFQGFQNYIANAYFWLLSGVTFGLAPRDARGPAWSEAAPPEVRIGAS